MAIQGIFLADFSQYNAAVDGADAKLRKFTSSTTSHDTASRQFNSTTDRGANSFGQLAQGLSEADRTLGTFGVHIQHEIHALEEISAASGKTASEIGLIGTATFTAAAAMGGWELGRKIAELFDLDQKVVSLADHLFNQGLAAQTAGAKQDTINRAIKDGADATITYTEAVQFNIAAANRHTEALKAHVKQLDEEKKAADRAAEALQKLQEAHIEEINKLENKLFGADAIKGATDYIEALGRVENVANLDTDALKNLFDALSAGISKMVEQGLAADDLTNQMEQFRIAVVQAQASHTQAVVTMETDEERFKRENDELAKAMKENFVIIGQSAQEAAQKVSMSWNEAMSAVRSGQGTLGGSFQSIAAGTKGSTVRYDDYGNAYGYIPGVNNPGKISPSGGAGGTNIFNFQDSYFDSPASQQRFASNVVNALGARVSSQGGR